MFREATFDHFHGGTSWRHCPSGHAWSPTWATTLASGSCLPSCQPTWRIFFTLRYKRYVKIPCEQSILYLCDSVTRNPRCQTNHRRVPFRMGSCQLYHTWLCSSLPSFTGTSSTAFERRGSFPQLQFGRCQTLSVRSFMAHPWDSKSVFFNERLLSLLRQKYWANSSLVNQPYSKVIFENRAVQYVQRLQLYRQAGTTVEDHWGQQVQSMVDSIVPPQLTSK